MAEFVVYKDKVNQFLWRFIADNGKIIADSGEGYINRSDCIHGIEIIKKEAPVAKVREIL